MDLERDLLDASRTEGHRVTKLVNSCHSIAKERGWWTNLETGEPKNRNVGELLCLVHSEISEAMEGYRKNLNDGILPEFKSIEVELADALIRIFDLAGGLNLRLGEAFAAKFMYNVTREDHSIKSRQAENGKKF